MAMQAPIPLVLISRKEVTAITTLSKTALYARLTPNPKRPGDYDPEFPCPVVLSANRVAWVKSEVEAWMAKKVQASRTDEIRIPTRLRGKAAKALLAHNGSGAHVC